MPLLARISHQFRRCQVQSFLQQTIVGYVCCKNTTEDGAAWTDLRWTLCEFKKTEKLSKAG